MIIYLFRLRVRRKHHAVGTASTMMQKNRTRSKTRPPLYLANHSNNRKVLFLVYLKIFLLFNCQICFLLVQYLNHSFKLSLLVYMHTWKINCLDCCLNAYIYFNLKSIINYNLKFQGSDVTSSDDDRPCLKKHHECNMACSSSSRRNFAVARAQKYIGYQSQYRCYACAVKLSTISSASQCRLFFYWLKFPKCEIFFDFITYWFNV